MKLTAVCWQFHLQYVDTTYMSNMMKNLIKHGDNFRVDN